MKKSLLDQLLDPKNIFKAIYSLESYVFEKELLSDADIKLYNELSDKYNSVKIRQIIAQCKKTLNQKLNSDELFDITVFFKPKKFEENKKEKYRPMHTADLITQICIVSMLNLIMFDDSDDTRKLSDICKLIPSNFYGNIPSTNVDRIFEPWNKKYSEYSKNIIEANREYFVTKKYTHEINLDLQKFFPSINPLYIYNFIWGKICDSYNEEDKIWLDKILKKLLFFNVIFTDSQQDVDYYYEIEPLILDEIKKQDLFFNVGIPQGLPQSYLFGNLCMIEITKATATKFAGDAYCYVDDSVIFTSKIDDFSNAISELNDKFGKLFSFDNESVLLPKELIKFNELISKSYQIKIHEPGNDSKTQITKIEIGDYLFNLAKPASSISFEIRASFDDLEDMTLRRKIKSILEFVQNKINDSQSIGNKELQTLLKRYKKFFTYRLKILDYRDDNEIDDSKLEEFYDNYGLSPFDKEKFSEKLEDDIFQYDAQMLLNFLIVDNKQQQELIKEVRNFENKLQNKFTNNYFSKVLKQHIKLQQLENQEYKSLECYAKNSFEPFLKVNFQKRIKTIKEIIISSEESEDNKISRVVKKYQCGFYEFIYKNSVEFKRKLYNSLLSYVLSIPINDSCNLIKIDNRPILYYELRILMYLRMNYNFNLNKFRNFVEAIFEDIKDNEEKIDLTLFEVLPYFKKYINDPQQIDDLILTHKFVNGIWKNGSKFLHFYTLHNEEHSVELVKNCTKITKSVDYLSVKKFDYYILFLSCYLHDVSMVLYPNIDYFNKEDNLESDLILSKWKNDLKKDDNNINTAPNTTMKKFIVNSFQVVNNYFEENIRVNHQKNSAKFIRTQSELKFIEQVTRKLVADISEAHGFDTKDVYGLKSNAKNDTISEKYLMIILRLADLLDMSKDRVSINILKQNIKQMPEYSQYHWISHMAIDKCTIETEFDSNIKLKNVNVKEKLKIKEDVIIKIYLNTKQMTSLKNAKPCKNINCQIVGRQSIVVSINQTDDISCDGKCNFTCKWMKDKHQYLFNELYSLQKYLSRTDTIFITSFKVIFEIDNTNRLSPEFMDVINNHLN
ncbi:MAG: hypothetical protein NTY07_08760 [Bacteroidia bacterium]|nr:hypothetical protein [Bacteroidia bacterium]